MGSVGGRAGQPGAGSLVRIATPADRITSKVATGHEPADVALTEGSVWVANRADGMVWRIDRGNAPSRQRFVSATSRQLAVGGGKVWVANLGDNTVMRIDSGTGRVEGAAISLGKDIHDLAASDDAVWVSAADGTVTRLDPATGEVVGSPLSPAARPALAGGERRRGMGRKRSRDRTLTRDRGGRMSALLTQHPDARRLAILKTGRLRMGVTAGVGSALTSSKNRIARAARASGSPLGRVAERPVSVLVTPVPADEESASALRDRARRLAAVTDARLLPVYGQGEDGAQLWLATRRTSGQSLDSVDRLERHRAARIGVEIADQLAAMQDAGVAPDEIGPADIVLEGAVARAAWLLPNPLRPQGPDAAGASRSLSTLLDGRPGEPLLADPQLDPPHSRRVRPSRGRAVPASAGLRCRVALLAVAAAILAVVLMRSPVVLRRHQRAGRE